MQTKMPASAEQSKQNQTVHSPTPLSVEPQTVFEDHRQQSAQLKETQTNMAVSQQQQGLQALQAKMNAGSRIQQLKEQQAHSNQSSQPNAIQRMEDEGPLQSKFEPGSEPATQLMDAPTPKPNNTGLPDNLKSGIENLSGISMDHVKVHYNSDKPAQLQAHAYAQGSEIHVAPGQEKHLPHEAWHVVQQAQGRVRPTVQMKGRVDVNDDEGLETEADVMGGEAINYNKSSKNTSKIVRATVNQNSIQKYCIQLIRYEGVEQNLNRMATDDLNLLINNPQELRRLGYEVTDLELPALQIEARQIIDNRRPQARGGFAMINRADENEGMNFLIAAADMELGEQEYQGPVEQRERVFNPENRNPNNRGDFGAIFAREIGHDGRRINADDLGRQQAIDLEEDPRHLEYLHAHGHGLGGREEVENAGIGSDRANTAMIPIEGAVAGRDDLIVRVVFTFREGTFLLVNILMTVHNQETGQELINHNVPGLLRVFTRAQYTALQREARIRVDRDVIEILADNPHLSVEEAIAAVGLIDLV